MKRVLALLVACTTVLAGCAQTATPGPPTDSPPAGAPTDVPPRPQPLRILAVGDSFTGGEGVAPSESWPQQLVAALEARGLAADIEVIAGTGWTARRAAAELDRRPVDGPYDIVFVQVGVNDHFYEFGLDNYRTGLNTIADHADRLTSDAADVIALSIIDWRATPIGKEYAAGYRSSDVADYNAHLNAFMVDRGHGYVDITTISLEQSGDPTLVAADGLHASGELYARWVDVLLLPTILERLEG